MRYEYRTGEIRAALRAHGSLNRAARALGIAHRCLTRACHDFDIPVPEWGWDWVQGLPPIDGHDELPAMLKLKLPATKACERCGCCISGDRRVKYCTPCAATSLRESHIRHNRLRTARKRAAA